MNVSGQSDDQVAWKCAKWAKCIQVQLKTSIFDSFDPISILFFISLFQLVCDTYIIHEGAAMWLLHFFMKKRAAAALNPRTALRSKSSRRRNIEGTLTT